MRRSRLRTPNMRGGAVHIPSAPPRQSTSVPLRSSAHGFRVPSDSPASFFQLAPAASVTNTRVQSPARALLEQFTIFIHKQKPGVACHPRQQTAHNIAPLRLVGDVNISISEKTDSIQRFLSNCRGTHNTAKQQMDISSQDSRWFLSCLQNQARSKDVSLQAHN